MIPGYDEEDFGEAIHEHVRPSEPIDTIELLKGRQEELDEIKRALFARGRNIFIYGDRGIGKSSLAQTAAFLYHSSDSSIIQIGCTRSSTFLGIMSAIAKRVADCLTIETLVKTGINLKIFHLEYQHKQSQKIDTPSIMNMDDALDLIMDISVIHSEKPILVIDEFDAIAEAEERYLFAEFLKKMGDSKVHPYYLQWNCHLFG